MKNSQTIRCQIESCSYNSPDHYCQLREIKVSPCGNCGCSSVSEKEQSMCASFREKPRSFF